VGKKISEVAHENSTNVEFCTIPTNCIDQLKCSIQALQESLTLKSSKISKTGQAKVDAAIPY
jgi:hypothetical protein